MTSSCHVVPLLNKTRSPVFSLFHTVTAQQTQGRDARYKQLEAFRFQASLRAGKPEHSTQAPNESGPDRPIHVVDYAPFWLSGWQASRC